MNPSRVKIREANLIMFPYTCCSNHWIKKIKLLHKWIDEYMNDGWINVKWNGSM